MKEIYSKYIYNKFWDYSESHSIGSITVCDGNCNKTVYKGDFITSKKKFLDKIRELNKIEKELLLKDKIKKLENLLNTINK